MGADAEQPPTAAADPAADERAAATPGEPVGASAAAARRLQNIRKSPLTYWVHGVRDVEIQQFLDSVGWTKVDFEENPNTPPLFARHRRTCKNPVVRAAKIRPFPYATCVSYCCDKKLFYTSMMASGYTRSVPETYLQFDAFAKFHDVDSSPTPGETWFVKTSDGCHGRGVNVFVDYKDMHKHIRSLHNEPYVIQRGVSKLNLIDGKKWTLRTHVLITGDLQIYRHAEGVVIVHSQEYELGGTDRASQILHDSRAQRHSWLTGPAKHLIDVVDPQIERISFEILDCIKAKFYKAAAGRENALPISDAPVHYALLGLDWIVDANNVLHCLEVNEFPQMDFSSESTPDAHNAAVAAFRDFLRLVVYPLTGTSYEEQDSVPPNGFKLFETQLDLDVVRREIQDQKAEKIRAATESPSPGFRRPNHRAREQEAPPIALPHSTDDEKMWFVKKAEEDALSSGSMPSPSAAAAMANTASSPLLAGDVAAYRRPRGTPSLTAQENAAQPPVRMLSAAQRTATQQRDRGSTAEGPRGSGSADGDVLNVKLTPRLPLTRARHHLERQPSEGLRPRYDTPKKDRSLNGGSLAGDCKQDFKERDRDRDFYRPSPHSHERFASPNFSKNLFRGGGMAQAVSLDDESSSPQNSSASMTEGRQRGGRKLDPDGDLGKEGASTRSIMHGLFNAPPNPPPVAITRPQKPTRQVLKMHNVGVRVAGNPTPPPATTCAPHASGAQSYQATAAPSHPTYRQHYSTTAFPPTSNASSMWPSAVSQIQSQMTGFSQALAKTHVERVPKMVDTAGTLRSIWMSNRSGRIA